MSADIIRNRRLQSASIKWFAKRRNYVAQIAVKYNIPAIVMG